MLYEDIIKQTLNYVHDSLKGAEGGHDYHHAMRVWKLAKHIAQKEKADLLTVELGALLHDIADAKFHDGDETLGARKASSFLRQQGLDEARITDVINIIDHISFKGGNSAQTFRSDELDIVQDADRLDAIGAIGIARTFNYGGFRNRELYNPEIAPNLQMTKEEYRNSTAPTINHFYEKLLLLKDRMNTQTGREMATHRHRYMEEFLEEFYNEWNGNC